MKEKGKQL